MLYCTYDQYTAAGGMVPETAFGVLCSRASRMIDAATFGRAESHAAGCEACREALAEMPAGRSSACWPLHLRRVLCRVLPAAPTTATASPFAAMPV